MKPYKIQAIYKDGSKRSFSSENFCFEPAALEELRLIFRAKDLDIDAFIHDLEHHCQMYLVHERMEKLFVDSKIIKSTLRTIQKNTHELQQTLDRIIKADNVEFGFLLRGLHQIHTDRDLEPVVENFRFLLKEFSSASVLTLNQMRSKAGRKRNVPARYLTARVIMSFNKYKLRPAMSRGSALEQTLVVCFEGVGSGPNSANDYIVELMPHFKDLADLLPLELFDRLDKIPSRSRMDKKRKKTTGKSLT